MTQVSNLHSIRLLLDSSNSIIAEVGDLQTVFEQENDVENTKQTMKQTATLKVQKDTLLIAIGDISSSIKLAPPSQQPTVEPTPIQPSTNTLTEPRKNHTGKKQYPAKPAGIGQAVLTQRESDAKFKFDTPPRARVRKVLEILPVAGNAEGLPPLPRR